MRIPIRIRQLPRFIVCLIKRAFFSTVDAKSPISFRLCYFTCKSYFPYLYCSIHSLLRLNTSIVIEIFVFCDRDELFNDKQVARLNSLGIPVKIIHWEKAQGWGSKQIISIWDAYELAASDAPVNTYIVRVDSDVFFLSDWIFYLVSKCGVDVIGDGHFVNFEYCQGGMYFFSIAAVRRTLSATPLIEFDSVFQKANIDVEDKAAYFLACKAGLRVWLPFFMMFPDEYNNAGSFNSYQRLKFSCFHYSKKDKTPMINIYLEQLLSDSERLELIKDIQL